MYLTPDQAAEYCHITKGYLATLRVRGDGPQYAKLGRRIVYKREWLDKWIEGNVFQSTAQYAGH